MRKRLLAQRPTRAHALLVALALVVFVGGLLLLGLGAARGAQAEPGASHIALPGSPTATDIPSGTPTNTPTGGTTPTVGATATRAPRTPTSSSDGGGGSAPTRVALGQPTIGSSSGSGQALAPSSIGSSGLMIATIVGCVSGVLGVIVAAISLTILLRGGYGPFLRTLLRRREKGGGRRRGATTRRIAGGDAGRGPVGAYAANGYRGSPSRRPAPPRGR